MQLDKTILTGERVRLEPLGPQHLPGLEQAIADGALYTLPFTTVPFAHELPQFLSNAEAAFAARRELAFATIDVASGAVVGSTRFRCIDPGHKRAEIGFTFIAAAWQRTHINTEAKYLMLRHAFEQWQCNRIEFLTDVRNTRSRQAIARLGAQQEGILRSHMVMRDGHIRDSVIFSIIGSEWPAVKSRLEARLGDSTDMRNNHK